MMINVKGFLLSFTLFFSAKMALLAEVKPLTQEEKVLNAASALAISKDNVTLLTELHKAGWNPIKPMITDGDYPPVDQNNPLHWAVFSRSPNAVKWLIEHKVDIFERDSDGFYAVQHLDDDVDSKKIAPLIKKALNVHPLVKSNNPENILAQIITKQIPKNGELVFVHLNDDLNKESFFKLLKKSNAVYHASDSAEKGDWGKADYRHKTTKKLGVMLSINLKKVTNQRYLFEMDLVRSGFSGRRLTGRLISLHGFWISENLVLTET